MTLNSLSDPPAHGFSSHQLEVMGRDLGQCIPLPSHTVVAGWQSRQAQRDQEEQPREQRQAERDSQEQASEREARKTKLKEQRKQKRKMKADVPSPDSQGTTQEAPRKKGKGPRLQLLELPETTGSPVSPVLVEGEDEPPATQVSPAATPAAISGAPHPRSPAEPPSGGQGGAAPGQASSSSSTLGVVPATHTGAAEGGVPPPAKAAPPLRPGGRTASQTARMLESRDYGKRLP